MRLADLWRDRIVTPTPSLPAYDPAGVRASAPIEDVLGQMTESVLNELGYVEGPRRGDLAAAMAEGCRRRIEAHLATDPRGKLAARLWRGEALEPQPDPFAPPSRWMAVTGSDRGDD